jgi:serine/threonine protein kinase
MSGADAARELLDRLADGAGIDWHGHADIDAPTLEAAHTLARVREAYRRVGSEVPRESALFHWGPLVVLERTATGSTGEVYRAWDPGLSSLVALKLMRPEAALAGFTNRQFLREAGLLARIGQRNVLRVFGAAVHDGRAGLWCEWLEGRSLAEIVAADGPLAEADATQTALALADALAAIHAAGLNHGDVKATNVIREHDGRVVLMDLGAGGSTQELADDPHTQATLAYLSPEARAGAARGPRDDLYALGVLMHYLLSAKYPEAGGKTLLALAPNTSHDLGRLVARAIDPDATRRFSSAREFAEALRKLGRRRTRVRATARWASAIAACALLAIGAWMLWPRAWNPQVELARRGATGLETLRDGAVLHNGDRIDLHLRSEFPTWAYVLNEDAQGVLHVLFPLSGLDHRNPLPAHEAIVLPGAQNGRRLSWEVSASDGRDEFAVVLSRAPIDSLEQRLRAIPEAAIQRGISRVVPTPSDAVIDSGTRLDAILHDIAGDLDDPKQVRAFTWHLLESTKN